MSATEPTTDTEAEAGGSAVTPTVEEAQQAAANEPVTDERTPPAPDEDRNP